MITYCLLTTFEVLGIECSIIIPNLHNQLISLFKDEEMEAQRA